MLLIHFCRLVEGSFCFLLGKIVENGNPQNESHSFAYIVFLVNIYLNCGKKSQSQCSMNSFSIASRKLNCCKLQIKLYNLLSQIKCAQRILKSCDLVTNSFKVEIV